MYPRKVAKKIKNIIKKIKLKVLITMLPLITRLLKIKNFRSNSLFHKFN